MVFFLLRFLIAMRVPVCFPWFHGFGVDRVEFSAKVQLGDVPAAGQHSGSYSWLVGRIDARTSSEFVETANAEAVE